MIAMCIHLFTTSAEIFWCFWITALKDDYIDTGSSWFSSVIPGKYLDKFYPMMNELCFIVSSWDCLTKGNPCYDSFHITDYNMATRHDYKWESWRVASCILNLSIIYRWLVRFTPWPLYSKVRHLSTHWIGGHLEPRDDLDVGQKVKTLTLPEIEPWYLGDSPSNLDIVSN